jgi:MFS family permease
VRKLPREARVRTQQAASKVPGNLGPLVVLCAASFMAQLDLFIVNIALPALSHAFPGGGLRSVSWVLNAYTITFAALLVPLGRLADGIGRKRVLLFGVCAFTLGSALSAGAGNLAELTMGRVIQAGGAASIVPTSLGLLLPAVQPGRRKTVVGVWAAV